jgi:hypothetical protein
MPGAPTAPRAMRQPRVTSQPSLPNQLPRGARPPQVPWKREFRVDQAKVAPLRAAMMKGRPCDWYWSLHKYWRSPGKTLEETQSRRGGIPDSRLREDALEMLQMGASSLPKWYGRGSDEDEGEDERVDETAYRLKASALKRLDRMARMFRNPHARARLEHVIIEIAGRLASTRIGADALIDDMEGAVVDEADAQLRKELESSM